MIGAYLVFALGAALMFIGMLSKPPLFLSELAESLPNLGPAFQAFYQMMIVWTGTVIASVGIAAGLVILEIRRAAGRQRKKERKERDKCLLA